MYRRGATSLPGVLARGGEWFDWLNTTKERLKNGAGIPCRRLPYVFFFLFLLTHAISAHATSASYWWIEVLVGG